MSGGVLSCHRKGEYPKYIGIVQELFINMVGIVPPYNCAYSLFRTKCLTSVQVIYDNTLEISKWSKLTNAAAG